MGEHFTPEEVRLHLRDECILAGGQKHWAAEHDVSPAYVNDVLHGRREPGDSILAPLGLRRLVVYTDALQSARSTTPGASDV